MRFVFVIGFLSFLGLNSFAAAGDIYGKYSYQSTGLDGTSYTTNLEIGPDHTNITSICKKDKNTVTISGNFQSAVSDDQYWILENKKIVPNTNVGEINCNASVSIEAHFYTFDGKTLTIEFEDEDPLVLTRQN